MDDNKVEKWTLDDGRRAERRVTENVTADGEAETVIEVRYEEEKPLKLQQRIVEKKKPIIYERVMQKIDPLSGKVLEQKVESIEPKINMQLVDHICVQEVEEIKKPQQGFSKDELVEAIVKAMQMESTQQKNFNPILDQSKFDNKLQSLGVADQIAQRVNKKQDMNQLLYGIILVEIAALAYLMFFM